ncbi:MAG: IS1182 family transposase [Fluviibacter sp.]|jgi:transposase
MKRFIEGDSKSQITLLPPCLDDYISQDNPIRVVEVFIDGLDLVGLGFSGATPAITGRPSYHPAVLLKLYLYGYLNRIASSRSLERESGRNLELMWLCGRLSPDFKTIADFRKDNGLAIRQVCRQFTQLCRQLNLFTDAMVAIDGSKFKAVNAHDQNFTQGKLAKRIKEVEESIEKYLIAMDTADRYPSQIAQPRAERLAEKIATLKKQMAGLQAMKAELDASPSGQISRTDPDARAMATSNSRGMVGYNVQTAVDTTHHLIVAHAVTNTGSDRRQLARMAKEAKDTMQAENLQAIADRGYFNGDEILACHEHGITPYVSKPHTSSAKSDGRFDKEDFIYDTTTNIYQCPAGSTLIHRFSRMEAGHLIHRYWSSDCKSCSLKQECTPSPNRRVSRWEHEALLDAMQERLDQLPTAMRIRRQTVEHPFGTIKHWMGARHFLTKTLEHVSTEMSLYVLAYNFKRVMKIVGMHEMMAIMRA